MAQIYVPDNPRERDQLQGATSTREGKSPSRRRTRTEQTVQTAHAPRRFGFIDLLVFLALISAIAFLVTAAARWAAPLTPAVTIDLSPTVLPLYAGYSLLRMILGYLLSLIFTLIYGQIAATNRRAGTVMVPVLDILQSIPILSFLPVVILALECRPGTRQHHFYFHQSSLEHDVQLLSFSALDVLTAANLRKELLGLWREQRMPTRAILMVTHNIDEAVSMANRILVLEANPGRVRVELPGLPIEQRNIQNEAQLETAINWGRYAELFTFQDDRGMFRQEETEQG